LPAQSGSSDVHTSLQDLLDYIRLAREWNEVEIVNVHTDVMDTNEQISDTSYKAPQIISVHDETHSSLQSRKDIFHNKWLDIYNIMEADIREGEYLKLRREWEIIESKEEERGAGTERVLMAQTALKIVPSASATNVQKLAPAHNKYLGTEWTMKNGLKVTVKQFDLVDAETEVIVNPANSELYHGGGAARAISLAASSELDDACRVHIRPYGGVKVGRAMHTTAGNLQPKIKYVIHAVGPQIQNRQECFDLVQSTVLYSLEHAEHVLKAVSISLPTISAGLFGVPKIDVA